VVRFYGLNRNLIWQIRHHLQDGQKHVSDLLFRLIVEFAHAVARIVVAFEQRPETINLIEFADALQRWSGVG